MNTKIKVRGEGKTTECLNVEPEIKDSKCSSDSNQISKKICKKMTAFILL